MKRGKDVLDYGNGRGVVYYTVEHDGFKVASQTENYERLEKYLQELIDLNELKEAA